MNGILTVRDTLGAEAVCYCDTDSIYIDLSVAPPLGINNDQDRNRI